MSGILLGKPTHTQCIHMHIGTASVMNDYYLNLPLSSHSPLQYGVDVLLLIEYTERTCHELLPE